MTASNVTAVMSTPPRSSVDGGGGGAGGGAPPMSLASPPLLFSACQPSPSSEQVIPATPEEEGTKKPADVGGGAEEWVGGGRKVATANGAAASCPAERVAMRCGDEASRIIYGLSRVVYSFRSRPPNKWWEKIVFKKKKKMWGVFAAESFRRRPLHDPDAPGALVLCTGARSSSVSLRLPLLLPLTPPLPSCEGSLYVLCE